MKGSTLVAIVPLPQSYARHKYIGQIFVELLSVYSDGIFTKSIGEGAQEAEQDLCPEFTLTSNIDKQFYAMFPETLGMPPCCREKSSGEGMTMFTCPALLAAGATIPNGKVTMATPEITNTTLVTTRECIVDPNKPCFHGKLSTTGTSIQSDKHSE